MRLDSARGAAIVAVLLVGGPPGGRADAQRKNPPDGDASCRNVTVAVFGKTDITEADLEKLAGGQLARLKSEEYRLKRQILDEHITKRLIEEEAGKRGVSVEDLTRQEVDSKAMPVSDEQKRAVYESNPAAYGGKSEEEAFGQIEANLRRTRLLEVKRKFVTALRTRAGARILLEPPRVAVEEGGSPALGPKAAPITLIEFSDFQCPYCSRMAPAITRLRSAYDEKVRIVFRSFPLPIHRQAPKAAEAALCSMDQGKFWEMHGKLFENQKDLAIPTLKRLAADLGLDVPLFTECVEAGKHSPTWQRDLADGKRYGVTGTPTLFVNGRMVTGAQSYESLAEIVDDELARIGSKQ